MMNEVNGTMALQNRYDFVIFFDVENGNPNGEPDGGNSPRIDAETGYGIVTDVCLKRKIRNYVELVKDGKEGYNILIKPDRALNSKFTEAYKKLNLEMPNKKGANAESVLRAREYMCSNYFDVRAFGAVMSTGDEPCGVVRGPVQLTFARSCSPVFVQDITITRQAKTSEERRETGETEMGRKSIIPYALYRAEGYVSAALANRTTKLSDNDLELLWTAILNMFENDHSAARGKMSVRKLILFKHSTELGACPSNTLFDLVTVRQLNNPPRAFSDYEITVPGQEQLPDGVQVIEKA